MRSFSLSLSLSLSLSAYVCLHIRVDQIFPYARKELAAREYNVGGVCLALALLHEKHGSRHSTLCDLLALLLVLGDR